MQPTSLELSYSRSGSARFGVAAESLYEAVDHFAYFDQLPQKRGGVGFGYGADVAGYYEVVLQLVAGVDGNAQEAGELFFACLASTLDDVGRDRHCGSNYLAPQRQVVGPADSHRDAVRVQGKCVRLLPNEQILEVTHPIGCGDGLPRSAITLSRPQPAVPRPPPEKLPAWKLQSL